MSTPRKRCNDDPNYDFYKCVESHFYKKRGCQYPWNVYNDLNVPVCTNYSDVKAWVEFSDRGYGHDRELFTDSEVATATGIECLPPCQQTIYAVKFERTSPLATGRSLQITFANFVISSREEHPACDTTCIIGELGGNLGFFLGGSILLGLDILLEYGLKIVQLFYTAKHARLRSRFHSSTSEIPST